MVTNGGFALQLEAGDSFEIVASEALAAPAAGDTIRLRDNDATTQTVWDLVHGTNATFVLGNATAAGTTIGTNRVLTVTVNATPAGGQLVSAGSTPGMQLPATITDQGGVTDVAGNGWNLAGSSDAVVDTEA
jgi:hypothetical protein